MENIITEKIAELKSIQEQLDQALTAYKESIVELEASKGELVPEVMEAFKGQTEGAEKLKISIEGMLVEIVQESERLTTSYQKAFETALTKVNENTRKVLEQILEDSKVAGKVKGQMKIDGSKVYEGMEDMFGKVKEWLSKAYGRITGFTSKAQEGVDEIEAMIKGYDEEQQNKYTQNMDDVESGATMEEDLNTNDGINKELGEGHGTQSGVAKLIMDLLSKEGIGSMALTGVLADAMENPDPKALEQAEKMLGSDVPPPNYPKNPDGTNSDVVIEDPTTVPPPNYPKNPDGTNSDVVIEDAPPSTEELLIGLGAVITIFGALAVASFKDKIIAAIKKAVGKGEEPTQTGMEETMHKEMEETMYNEVEEGSFMKTRAGAKGEVFENEKLEEAVNRIKQILKY